MIAPGTPLPWATTKRNPRKVTADGVLICTAVIRNSGTTKQNKNGKGEEVAKANAAYIVHACNLYPELFEYVESSAMNGCATAQALVSKAKGDAK